MKLRQGEVYLHPRFRYRNGNIDDKYIIILNKIPASHLPLVVVPVTKNPQYEKLSIGCNPIPSLFKILAGTCFFPLDTYVQLSEYVPLDYVGFSKEVDDKHIILKHTIDKNFLVKILNCFQHQQAEVDQDLYDLVI